MKSEDGLEEVVGVLCMICFRKGLSGTRFGWEEVRYKNWVRFICPDCRREWEGEPC